jgi:hypothetical protein
LPVLQLLAGRHAASIAKHDPTLGPAPESVRPASSRRPASVADPGVVGSTVVTV